MTNKPFTSGQSASLFRNIFANLCGYCVSAIVALLISPIVVHALGDTRYGAWSLFGDLIGYYGLLDAGITGAVTFFVARHLGKSDVSRLKSTISTAFLTLAGIGIVALVIGAVVAVRLPALIHNSAIDATEVRLSFVIMLLSIAANFPLAIFSATLVGYRRLDIVNLTEIGTKVISAVAIWVVLHRGAGMVGLASITAGARVLTWAILIVTVKNIGAPLPTPRCFRWSDLKELLSYGGKNALINVAGKLIYRTDSLIVTLFLGVNWVTYFTIGAMLVTYFSSACSALALAFTPHLTYANAKGDLTERNELYLLGVRLTSLLATAGAVYVLAFGKSFIHLWLGEAYVSGPLTFRTDIVIVILVFAELPHIFQSISRQLLFATEQQRYLMWLSIGEGLANLLLSLLLVKPLGLAGIALGTMLPALVTHLWFLPKHVLTTFSISFKSYFVNGLMRPLITGAMIGGLSYSLVTLYTPLSWITFLAEVLLAGAAGLFLIAVFGLTRAEQLRSQRAIVSMVTSFSMTVRSFWSLPTCVR